MDNPVVILVMLGVGLYLGKLWLDDKRTPHSRSLPGATPATRAATFIAILGALGLLTLETIGEKQLGISEQQSTMTWLFAAYSILGAPILEELVFRGYLVVSGKGQRILWASVIAFSLGFAVLHQHLWSWDNGAFAFTFTPKGWFSTGVLFATSLWLYASRFAPWNASRSLFPCFAAHAAKNAGVVIVKAASGYMGGLW